MSGEPQGPVMICVTNILRPPPARVGKITDNLVLPRTIELRKLIAGGVGFFTGMLLWMLVIGFFTGHSFVSLAVTAGLFSFLAVFLMSWSPLRGESFTTWLGLSSNALTADRVRIDGLRVRAYIGVAPLHATAGGKTRVLPGAVDVPLGSVDERGVAYPKENLLLRAQEELQGFSSSLPSEGFEDPKPLPR
jgi:hypothetical protein